MPVYTSAAYLMNWMPTFILHSQSPYYVLHKHFPDYKFLKALYGLKQAPRAWLERLTLLCWLLGSKLVDVTPHYFIFMVLNTAYLFWSMLMTKLSQAVILWLFSSLFLSSKYGANYVKDPTLFRSIVGSLYSMWRLLVLKLVFQSTKCVEFILATRRTLVSCQTRSEVSQRNYESLSLISDSQYLSTFSSYCIQWLQIGRQMWMTNVQSKVLASILVLAWFLGGQRNKIL